MSTSLPAYVDIPGRSDASVIPPGVFTGARGWVFAVQADQGRLQALADRILATPTGGTVTATVPVPLAFFMFFNGDRLSSPRQPIGWTSNHECVIAFPVLVHRPGLLDYQVGLFTPFVYIDNYRGMVTGRESWGYFKNLGNVTAPKQWTSDFSCTLDTLIFQPASPGTEGVVSRLVTVNSSAAGVPTDITGEPPEQLRQLIEHFAGHAGQDVLDIFWKAAGKLLLPFQMPAFNLKQFRDVADGTKACYQAITTSPLEVTTIRSMQLLPPGLTVSIETCANAGIAELLGLAPSPIPVQYAAGVDFDYQAIPGDVLWQA